MRDPVAPSWQGSRISAHASLDEGDVVRRALAAFGNLDRLLNAVGLMAVAHSQKAFDDQAFSGIPWEPRMNPNIPGVITDVNAGKTPRPQRFTDRPALVDTGRLHASIAHRIVGPDTVEVGSRLPYASIHHLGLDSESPAITKQGQKKLAEWFRSLGMGRLKRFITQGAKLKAKADAAFSRSYAHIWPRAKKAALDARLKNDAAYQTAATQLAAGNGSAAAHKRAMQQRKAFHRSALAQGGIMNPEVRAQYQRLLGTYQGKRATTHAKITADTLAKVSGEKQRRASNPRFAQAMSLRFLLSPTMLGVTRTIHHPARPFIGIPPELRLEVQRHLGLQIGIA